jgi:GMP synthase-like glutamine amidotransferase
MTSMRQSLPTFLAIEHESDSGPALLAEAAIARGFAVDIRNPTDAEQWPTNLDGYVAVLVMGAAASVYDEDAQWWFQREVALLQEADRVGLPIFGVCFGAQAMSVAFGGSVRRASQSEVGWYHVTSTDTALIPEGPWFAWHVDECLPPAEAQILATTEVCVQAFSLGRHLAVQFHPEVTDQQAQDWGTEDPKSLARHGLGREDLMAQSRAELPAARLRAMDLFDAFCRHASIEARVVA